MNQSKLKIVYVVTSRNEKSFWNRIGCAFVNSDGSLNVKLDAVPIDKEATMQIRDYVPREDGEPVGANGAQESAAASF